MRTLYSYAVVGVSSNSEVPGSVKQNLVSAYKRNLANKLKSEVQDNIDDQPQDGLTDQKVARWATTWWQQFSVLLRRGVKERKHDSFSGLKIAQVLVVAFLSGLLWWQSDVSHLQDQVTFCDNLTFPESRFVNRELLLTYFGIITICIRKYKCRWGSSSFTQDSGASSLYSKLFSPSPKNVVCSKRNDRPACIDCHHTSCQGLSVTSQWS
jgi:hypothetical protein